jgi:hypothetical protein
MLWPNIFVWGNRQFPPNFGILPSDVFSLYRAEVQDLQNLYTLEKAWKTFRGDTYGLYWYKSYRFGLTVCQDEQSSLLTVMSVLFYTHIHISNTQYVSHKSDNCSQCTDITNTIKKILKFYCCFTRAWNFVSHPYGTNKLWGCLKVRCWEYLDLGEIMYKGNEKIRYMLYNLHSSYNGQVLAPSHHVGT